MAIEQSHGKARPTLPRSSDLSDPPDTADERSVGRDAQGRVAVGNTLARGKGWKQAIKKLAGVAVDGDEVAEDAWRLFCASIRDLPSDGPNVRSLVALKARHEAIAGYFSKRAAELGLNTDEGMAADDRAIKHSLRAERLTVTALDVANRLAAKRGHDEPFDLARDLKK